MSSPGLAFVLPDPQRRISGGHRYNAGLLSALARAGVAFAQLEATSPALPRVLPRCESVWVDSLYLAELPRLRERLSARARLGLIAHALPSFLRHGDGWSSRGLLPVESGALAAISCAIAPSLTLATQLAQIAPHVKLGVVEPAIHRVTWAGPRPPPYRATMVAHLIENKRVLPFLSALGEQLRDDDPFRLEVIGSLTEDPAYALSCQRLLTADLRLAQRVRLRGELPHAQVMAALSRSHCLLSSSRVESFGMAIADAWASGLVVLACRGGHVGALIDPLAGAALSDDERELARVFLELVRDPDHFERLRAQAGARPVRARSWDDVARDFLNF